MLSSFLSKTQGYSVEESQKDKLKSRKCSEILDLYLDFSHFNGVCNQAY